MRTYKRIFLLSFSLILLTFTGKCQELNGYSSISKKQNITIAQPESTVSDVIENTSEEDFKSGEEDANEYYTDNKAFAVSFFSSVILPPVGFITTIALSTSQPKTSNLNAPNDEMLKNNEYIKGYKHKALKMKARRAWGGCLTGLSFFGIACFMVY